MAAPGKGYIETIGDQAAGVGDPNDPSFRILRKYLQGPELKLYWDFLQDVRRLGPDQWEKGDGLRAKAFKEGLRQAIYRARNPDTGDDYTP